MRCSKGSVVIAFAVPDPILMSFDMFNANFIYYRTIFLYHKIMLTN